MKALFKFVAGNSRVTPVGIAIAVALALLLIHRSSWTAIVYVAVLGLTLVMSTFERV